MERLDLSKYDKLNVVDRLNWLDYDMIEFLEKRIEKDVLMERIEYVIDKFEKMRG